MTRDFPPFGAHALSPRRGQLVVHSRRHAGDLPPRCERPFQPWLCGDGPAHARSRSGMSAASPVAGPEATRRRKWLDEPASRSGTSLGSRRGVRVNWSRSM